LHPIRRLERFLFEPDQQPPLPALRVLLGLLRYPYGMLRDLLQGELNLRAMSLVYTTLLAVVPLAAFGFAVLKAVGAHRMLEPVLFEFLSPLGNQAHALTTQVMGFVERVRGDVLGSLGLVFLLYTIITTIQKIEESFNFAWHVGQPRSLARRVSEYLALMVAGPLCLFIVTGLLGAAADLRMARWLAARQPFGALLGLTGAAAPYLFVMAAFSLLYFFIPNTRVRVRAALTGGVVAGLAWVAVGALFARIVVASTHMVAIYAGFAIFLVTLIWIYLSWLILMLGAQLSFYVQNPRYLRAGQAHIRLTSRLRERLALSLMYMTGCAFVAGGRPLQLRQLADRLEVPGSALLSVSESLERAGLLLVSADEQVVPGRPLDQISVHDVLLAVRDEQQYQPWLLAQARTAPAADAMADEVEAAIRASTAGCSLRELCDRPPA